MFISKRFDYYDLSGDINPIAKLYFSYKEKGQLIYDLTLSNPTKASIRYPKYEILQALNDANVLLYDPNPKGLDIARKSICEYYNNHGYSIYPEDLFLTSGTSEAYSYLLKLLCNPNDEVLIPAPSYPLLDFIASLETVNVVPYYLSRNDNSKWCISQKSLEESITTKTKAILFVQPNNPTGNILSTDEIDILISVAEKYCLPLIIDEVFRDYTFSSKQPVILSSEKIPIFTLNGISKILGLPQLKLSWILVSAPENMKNEIYEALEIIADTFLSVNTPVQTALPKLFEFLNPIQSEIKNRITNNLRYATNSFATHPILSLSVPDGGWYLVVEVKNIDVNDEELVLNLLKYSGVYIHPGSMFRFPHGKYIVISLLPQEEVFQEGVNRICQYFV
ncbi:MAG TPA: pyridoxal phosphate-dependent aminotransferase [Candidatus Hydrogenedens sp.]|nr:pyridoxal phosphate-dependent aminotransferase [Candidatus Hydrogenedens sp.]HOL21056.1 pyridoxal phosphate-dependent aminotransferase [Candidatus Hydrogenedens sp.]HPP58691.1 pyridoxal phosphate-dependent aminotransferase [Candidatus Hydrogenedens sp.]